MLTPPSQPLCCRVPPPTALTKAVSPRLGCAVVSLPSEMCSRWTSLALSMLNLGHPPRGQDEAGTSHPPSTLVEGSRSSIPAHQSPHGTTPVKHTSSGAGSGRATTIRRLSQPCALPLDSVQCCQRLVAPCSRHRACYATMQRQSPADALGLVAWHLQSPSPAEVGAGNELTAQKAGHLLGFTAAFVQSKLLGSAAGELSCLVTV